ncbi:MAG: InlB B-repeat-containing protein [Bacteroidales bacterium]|nr:InlB B-repeat-containing protein [Bacteroidales bacterium]
MIRFLNLMMCLVLFIYSSHTIAQTNYTLTSDDVVVTGGVIQSCSYDFSQNDNGTNLTIPSVLDGQQVLGIKSGLSNSGVFIGKNITSITLPQSITHIGDYAFINNAIVAHNISSCSNIKTIGLGAFKNNSITQLDFSSCMALTAIKHSAFCDNSISTLNLTNCTKLKLIDRTAFHGNNISSLDLSTCTSLEEIGNWAFSENSIASVNLKNCSALKTIGIEAFLYNKLKSVDLSSCTSLTEICSNAFTGNSTETLNLENCTALKVIGRKAFYRNKIKNLDLSSCISLIEIGKEAFYNNLTKTLNLSNCSKLKVIRESAFSANGIENLNLNDCVSLQVLESKAFSSHQNTSLNLSSCKALIRIDSKALDSYKLSGFTLPSHDFIGNRGWQDDNGNQYASGSTVTNLDLGYRISGTYWIDYDLQGGSNHPDNLAYYISEDGISSFEDASKTGHTFRGWYKKVNYSYVLITEIEKGQTGDILIQAGYNTAAYNIVFNSNGGTGSMASQSLYFNSSKSLRANTFTRLGSNFTGWNTKADGSGESYADGAYFTMNQEGITLYAQWDVGSYNVSFHANGGSGTMIDQNVKYGQSITLNANTYTRFGYIFDGWNTESDGSGDSYADKTNFTMNAEGATLYAKWKVADYTILYHLNGGLNSSSNPSIYNITSEITFEDASKTGHAFNGWYSDAACTNEKNNITAGSTGNVKLWAKFTTNDYDIVFNKNGGAGSMANQTFKFNSSKELNNNAYSRVGYTFNEWNSEDDGSGVSLQDGAMFTMKVEGEILYAQWAANTYDVVYDANGGEGKIANQRISFDATANLFENTLTRSDYIFSGWNTKADGSGSAYADKAAFKMSVEGTTLYAQWKEETFVITYHLDGGTNSMENPGSYTINDELIFGRAMKSGYNFEGWFSDAAFTNVVKGIDLGSSGDMEIWAKFTARDYKVVFMPNGGLGEMTDQEIAYNSTSNLKPNTFTMMGHRFAGWKTEPDGNSALYADGAEVSLSRTLTLFAHWVVGEYDITFEPNGGLGNMAAQRMKFQTEGMLNTNAFNRKGYEFLGWNTKADGTGIAFSDGDIFAMFFEGITLYAQWKAEKYNITYHLEGGINSASNPASYSINDDVTLADATKQGFTFCGWYSDPGYTNLVTSINKGSTGDVKLWAKFEQTSSLESVNKDVYSIYPIPAIDRVNLNGYQQGELISVYSLNGTKVLSTVNTFDMIDISNLNPGAYYLKSNSNSIVLKFIKE